MQGEAATDRRVYEISGANRIEFLQSLVSNNIGRLKDGLVYAALLTPQGKYLADFFLVPRGEAILLDVKDEIAEATVRRLSMYKLRAEVEVTPWEGDVTRGLGDPPDGAYPDPRHPALGWRAYGAEPGAAPRIDWDAIRVDHCIPETGIELIPNETYILEAGFERLNGVDFRKGCYVGQEVTARMKHKTELRKGLVTLDVVGDAPAGTAITADGRPAGTLHTRTGNRAIAYLRLDRARGDLRAGTAKVNLGGG